MVMFKKIFLVLFLLSAFSKSYADEPFVIEDIVIEGLQRVDVGTIYTYLLLK